MNWILSRPATLFLLCLSWTVAEAEDRARDGGPDSVDALLEDQAAEKRNLLGTDLIGRWNEAKASLAESTGLSLGLDYSSQGLLSNEVPAGIEDSAASGMVRFYGKWELVDRGGPFSGTLNWKVEHRHRYTDLPPSGFGLASGYVGIFAPPFSDQGSRLTNLFWRQGLGENWVTYIGFLDATDFVDVYALASPWTGFNNFAFSTGAASMALPNDAALGIMLGGWLSDSLYVIGSLTDLNSDPTDPFQGFDSFFSENEYFKSVELGWSTSKDRFFADNVHLTFWHVDDVAATGNPDGWGVNFSASYWVDDLWMPFLRAGYADDGGSLLERSVTLGVAMNVFDQRDLIGLAGNWGRPNESSFGPGLDDQGTVELFYRLQVSQNIRLTPSLQLLFDPALNPDEDFMAVYGLRAVVSF